MNYIAAIIILLLWGVPNILSLSYISLEDKLPISLPTKVISFSMTITNLCIIFSLVFSSFVKSLTKTEKLIKILRTIIKVQLIALTLYICWAIGNKDSTYLFHKEDGGHIYNITVLLYNSILTQQIFFTLVINVILYRMIRKNG